MLSVCETRIRAYDEGVMEETEAADPNPRLKWIGLGNHWVIG